MCVYIYVTDCTPRQACIALFNFQRMGHLTELRLEADGIPLGFSSLALGV